MTVEFLEGLKWFGAGLVSALVIYDRLVKNPIEKQALSFEKQTNELNKTMTTLNLTMQTMSDNLVKLDKEYATSKVAMDKDIGSLQVGVKGLQDDVEHLDTRVTHLEKAKMVN